MDVDARRRWLIEEARALSLPAEVSEALADWPGVHLALYTRPTVDGEPIPILDLGHVQLKLRLPAYARLRERLAAASFAHDEEPLPFEVIRTYEPRRKLV